ncbi:MULTISPECIES: DUF308 domain-containing protein [unclassified Bifidobacterium]|uniref:DUF308 domain-containing protein n=1 Tax=unclassified Bifidobacterium TaxID=2608897 RepID=UPI0023F83F8A|nr:MULTISPECIES: DUF308 domain-containing protein [unclassified Bifidobacterium]WEV66329.1 DUF308 domain-containing protein [Bifidobacterium sp. ESL0764]WEV76392.1 DUF308 domain-containing protein [Bifidobacterium sp. ESL0800]
MTSLKDSNSSDDKRDDADSHARCDAGLGESGDTQDIHPDTAELEEAWKRFEDEHAEDLDDISSSRQAKRFEKHAKREEKKAQLSIEDITPDSFAKGSSSSSRPRGPRDFEGSSWLDVDDVMDGFDDFTPPNPDLGHLDPVKVVFWGLLIVGIAGLIAAVFFPKFAGIMGIVFGLCALIGGAGLLITHKGFHQTQTDYFDDGSRV